MATWLNHLPTNAYAYDPPVYGVGSDLSGLVSQVLSFLTSFTGLSMFATVFGGGHLGQTADAAGSKIIPVLVLGYLFNIARRLVMWFLQRFRFQYYITAQFTEGDPTYDWLVLLLTDEGVWKNSKDFRVSSKTSQRKWSIGLTKDSKGKKGEVESAEYTPTYDAPQLWRWGGYLIEVTRYHVPAPLMNEYSPPGPRTTAGSSLYLTIYTFDVQVLSRLVETARAKYSEISRPYVLVHSMDTAQPSYGPVMTWNNVKRKNRRPMESIILAEGVLESIASDAREFINMEEWYLDAGIPHRRGYLLHGPPGTGKTSTIYALAGELGMEIYSLSLASNFVDDNVLNRAATAIPKNSIFLIEDIDCAFPSREDEDDDETMGGPIMGPGGYMIPAYPRAAMMRNGVRSAVTLSGLLNVLDGVGSEEGKLFFATTNYIDHLDPALMRPGRIDMKIQYHLANTMQAAALFRRFFPIKHAKLFDIPASASSLIDHPLPSGGFDTSGASEKTQEEKDAEKDAAISAYLDDLAESFSKNVPESEFSTAELQGYLLIHKREPLKAASCIGEWVSSERKLKEDKKKRDDEKKARMKAKAQEMWNAGGGAFGGMRQAPFTPPSPPPPAPIPVVPVAIEPSGLPLLPTPDLERQGLTLPASESSSSLVVA